ncbi:MAG: hypothetical protein AAFY02_16250 [Pseudomonadota bacterium]
MKRFDIDMTETDYTILQKALEKRYGEAVAEDIMKHIRLADQPNAEPNYCSVKALSEVTEKSRDEVREKVKRVKRDKPKSETRASGVVDFDREKRHADLEEALDLYLRSQRLYYRSYQKMRRALMDEVPEPKRYKKRKEPEVLLAA